ncbi:helix-turn-helix transcriptional regulator [Streptomyces sp. NPDC006872]|uniref:helix-turn-helix domain-containing protein n=1 Tax=Streptomyces sp. NPDC006872 TaxID=3155720 RepID=UPI0033C52C3A
MRDLPDDDTWITDRRRAIGDHLRQERRRQNLTQDQVWQAARVDRRTLQFVESGAEVKLSTLLRIAWVLEVPLGDLD